MRPTAFANGSPSRGVKFSAQPVFAQDGIVIGEGDEHSLRRRDAAVALLTRGDRVEDNLQRNPAFLRQFPRPLQERGFGIAQQD